MNKFLSAERAAHATGDGGAALLHVVGAEPQDRVAVDGERRVTREVSVAVVRAAMVWAVHAFVRVLRL